MTNNSKIHLRGIKTPFLCSKQESDLVSKIFNDKSISGDYTIELKNHSFKKSEIRLVEIEKDGSRAETWDKIIDDDILKANAKRKSFLQKTPEQKAICLDIFELLYKISMGEDCPIEIKRKAYVIQLGFYRTNSQRTMVDPSLLRILIPHKSRKLNSYESAGLSIIERSVRSDMLTAEKFPVKI